MTDTHSSTQTTYDTLHCLESSAITTPYDDGYPCITTPPPGFYAACTIHTTEEDEPATPTGIDKVSEI